MHTCIVFKFVIENERHLLTLFVQPYLIMHQSIHGSFRVYLGISISCVCVCVCICVYMCVCLCCCMYVYVLMYTAGHASSSCECVLYVVEFGSVYLCKCLRLFVSVCSHECLFKCDTYIL